MKGIGISERQRTNASNTMNQKSWKMRQFFAQQYSETPSQMIYFRVFKVVNEVMSISVTLCTAFMWSLSFVKVFPH